MAGVMEVISGVSCAVLFPWILVECWKQQRRHAKVEELRTVGRKSTTSTLIIVLSNVLICTFHVGFCFYRLWNHKTLHVNSVLETVSWVCVVAFTICSKNEVVTEERRWPLVLIFWWIFSSILNYFVVSFYLFVYFSSKGSLGFLVEANFTEFVKFPLSILLFANALKFSCNKNEHETRCPLLERETQNGERDYGAFASAGIWSRLTFQWLNPLFKIGQTSKLELRHVPSIPESETAEKSFASLEKSIQSQKPEAFSLSVALIRVVWKPLAINAVFAGMSTIASYMGPLLVTDFVDFLSGKRDYSSNYNGVILAIIFFIAKTVESLSQRQWYFGASQIGIRIRAALMVSIYKKSLLLKYSGPNNGRVVNFINVDAEKIGDFSLQIHEVWLLPVQVFLALVILCKNLGVWPSMAALLTTIFVVSTNTPIAHIQQKIHSKIMEAKDSRVKATSETLKSMRVLKLYAWEATYLKSILNLRETEKSWLKRYLYIKAAIVFLFWTSPTLVSVVTFSICNLLQTPLTSGTVLSALATFRILQEPIYNLPELMSMIAQTKVSLNRIQNFIREEEPQSLSPNYITKASDVAIEIGTGEFTWKIKPNSKDPIITITENMKIMEGDKIAVCGSVGSGKSSFLSSIIGEIPMISGSGTKVYGTKAYVPQSAWVQSGTIRENVLFGKDMKEDYFEDVLRGCALNKDVEMWYGGDLSVVGERGINLSGGQKQRIQLARAIYNDADVYLLDDPFSAVDAHTAAYIFKECLMRLLSQKTVIYVTHQLEFLESSDLVLVVKDGRIVQSGKYGNLMTDHDGEFFKQMDAHNKYVIQVNTSLENQFFSYENQMKQTELSDKNLDDNKSNVDLPETIREEESETGRVKWWVYSSFMTLAYKGYLVPVVLLSHIFFQALQIGSNYWIAWATEEEGRVSREKSLKVFVLLSGGSSIFILLRAFLLATIATETAQSLFLGMIKSVFRAPISFFDSTPSSRILNKSSIDQSTVDTDIPFRLAGLVFALIQLLSIIILMSYVAWQVIPLFVAILAISMWYQAYYISTARELGRMVGIRKSPILHHFSESIAGAATIRCFNQEERFLKKILKLINEYSQLVFHNFATMEWLCVRINFLFNLVFFLVLIILVCLPRSAISPSLAGLAATYGLNLNVLQAWVIWNLCNVENKMISVERILQYFHIPSEAPSVIEECRPNSDWPTDGTIELNNLHVQYSPSLPMVLKGITCKFPGKKKIGVVGRTGSGKSTLIQALFRVVEPSYGKILIDGVDICKIGLQDLRSRLSIIPQDPTLFQGSMRNNLDPLCQHSDLEIWEAIDKCRLGDVVRQDARLLDAPEDGKNWSVGQRQLFCLARILLKRRRILVLDEATASVDIATDTLIQKTIRDETSGCTVITVAHRIPTIIDADIVLLLDEGRVIEYDTPDQLQNDKTSAFSKLVTEFLKSSSKSSCYR